VEQHPQAEPLVAPAEKVPAIAETPAVAATAAVSELASPARRVARHADPQIAAAVAIVGAALAGWSAILFMHGTTIPNPPPNVGIHASDLSDHLDPNTATAAELAEIPRLGEKHAAEIVAYRESFLAAHPNGRAFATLNDLTHIRGIGPATLKLMAPYLEFGKAK
jgi:DNA uptake protein ComE-like DNA-binding protein